MLMFVPPVVMTPQSHDEQHSAQTPVSGQQRSPKGQVVSARWQTPFGVQLSVVQGLPSSQSVFETHSTQPRCAWQIVPAVQLALLGM
jgi:hypothetical protein